MKSTVEAIARAIASVPGAVRVSEETGEKGTTLRLQVADVDRGRIIGKQGKVIKAIRSVVGVAAAKAGRKVAVEID